jgi:type IV pilus assembly protein PilA
MHNKPNQQIRRARQSGFSLIELLIVVAIILIIAAIAIPSLLRAKISANEASAVNSVRSYTTGNVTYNSICPEIGYPATLADLGPGGGTCVGGANIVDNILGVASPTKAGYSFTYVPTVGTGGANVSYTINANPLVPGMTGQRGFYSDQTGTIRYALSGVATPASSAL